MTNNDLNIELEPYVRWFFHLVSDVAGSSNTDAERIDYMYKAMEQIEKEYDGQWVFMINCQKDKHNAVSGGEVVFHDKSMNAVLRTMKDANEKGNSTYVRYIGVLPEGVAVML